ncbi:hypothetical protein DOY81_015149, partial [Sarcophaga bullata]
MLKFKNCRVIFNNNATRNLFLNKQQQQQLLLVVEQKPLNLRLQSTAVVQNDAHTEAAASKEWEQAKPFEDIPSAGKFKFIRNFLPGGRYAKMDSTQMLNAFKEDYGNIARLPGFFGREDVVMTHNVEDFEKVLRNEGIWPNRPGSEALHYHRNVHRAEFFQGIEGLIATQNETWGTFRSAVNPVMMQPKNVRLYLHKMSDVNKEFIDRIRQIRDPATLEVPETFEEEINRWTLESVSVVALDKQLGLITKNRDNP